MMSSPTTIVQLWSQIDLSSISLAVLAVASLFVAVYTTMRGADFVLCALTGMERIKRGRRTFYRRRPDSILQPHDVRCNRRAWREWQRRT